ncbi:hypothetical protein EJ110_NYTH17607 [Nymphaea thermarum]|nr:hypothetical protein EJ110_NYTH17607 [Nymphaea thermarum]
MVAAAAIASPSLSLPKSDFLQNAAFANNPSSQLLVGVSKNGPLHTKVSSKRREGVNVVVAAASSNTSSRFYLNFTGFPFPLGPFLNRRTIRRKMDASQLCGPSLGGLTCRQQDTQNVDMSASASKFACACMRLYVDDLQSLSNPIGPCSTAKVIPATSARGRRHSLLYSVLLLLPPENAPKKSHKIGSNLV